LNVSNPEVRSYLLQVARYWIERCDIDGWRLDVPWKIPMDFWREFRQVVKAARPDEYIVAETWRDTAHWLQGDTCDGTMNHPLRDYILDYCVRDSMDAEDFDYFASRLRQVHGPADAFQLNLLGSHDTPRLRTLSGSTPRLLLAVAAQFTLPGVPMIYYGDEVGLFGENDPGCRAAMPWDTAGWDEHIRSAYRKLIHARRQHPALSRAPVERLLAFNGVYAFCRKLEEDEIIVVLNPRGEQQDLTIPLPADSPACPRRDLLTGITISPVSSGLYLPTLPSETALILSTS
jgi:glycosidase